MAAHQVPVSGILQARILEWVAIAFSRKLFNQPLKEDARCPRGSQVAPCVKNQPAMQEMPERWVQFLGQEDPLEEGTATQSSIPAYRIPWTEEPGRLPSMGSQRGGHG